MSADALVAVGLLAGCEDMKKYREKQIQDRPRRVQGAGRPEQHAPASQPLFRQREFNAVEPDQDGPLIRADVMLVNGQTVKASDVLEPSWERLEEMAVTAKPSEYPERVQLEIRQRVRETISEFLVWHEVKKKLTSDMEDPLKKAVDAKVRERINKDFEGSQAKFERYLSQRGLSLEDYKEQEKRRVATVQFLREEILPQIHISRRQLRRVLRENRKSYESPAKVRLQMIDLPDKAFLRRGGTTRQRGSQAHDAAAAQAKMALAELKAGADFAETAKKYSKGLHAEEGGRWDWVNEDPGLQGRWTMPSKAAFGLAAGQCSDILEASDGYFIVRAEEKVDATARSSRRSSRNSRSSCATLMFDALSGQYMSKLWVKGDIQGLTAFNARLLTLVPKSKVKAACRLSRGRQRRSRESSGKRLTRRQRDDQGRQLPGVALDVGDDVGGEFDGGHAVLGGDRGGALALDGVDEGLQFGAQRLDVVDLQRLDLDHRAEVEPANLREVLGVVLAGHLEQVEVGILLDRDAALLLVIERQVGLLAEDADLALGLEGQPRGGQVGHAAVGEASRGRWRCPRAGPSTLTPTASTCTGLARTRCSTMSMSWIIMSMTTPMSAERKVNGLMRCVSMNRGVTSMRSIARTTGLNRSVWPTCTRTLCLRARSTICRASSTSGASGFSISTAMPASRSGRATARWATVGTATVTASTLPSSGSIDV